MAIVFALFLLLMFIISFLVSRALGTPNPEIVGLLSTIIVAASNIYIAIDELKDEIKKL